MLLHGLELAEQVAGNPPAIRTAPGEIPAFQALQARDELRPIDIDDALPVRARDQLAVQRRHTHLADLAPAFLSQLRLEAGPQHPGCDLLRMLADTRRDQPGGNEQVLPVCTLPPHQHMAVRVPVIDRAACPAFAPDPPSPPGRTA